MKVLILYAKNKSELFNRKSALGSYIYCLSTLINDDDIDLYLNGVQFNKILNSELGENEKKESGKQSVVSKIAKLIPSSIKSIIKEILQLNKVKKFKNELLESNVKYDCILEFYTIGSNIGVELANLNDSKYIITYDGPIIEEFKFFNNKEPFFKNLINKRKKQSLQRANSVVVASDSMKNFIIDKGVDEGIILTHQNVDFARFDILEEEKIKTSDIINICFIGSFLKWHQVDMLVSVFQDLLKINSKLKLYLIGDGVERNAIDEIISSLDSSVASKIEMTGFVDSEELFDLKKKMDIGVMPGSNWYGSPLKIYEYGAMKLAVVAPDTPTISDLFNKDEIELFEWRNEEGLYNSLKLLIQDESKLETFANNLNKKILNKYNPKNTRLFYKDLIN